ncbi:MAG: UDP-N-acetylglucosamine acyltransferase [Planctomycetota bacterium]|jgi:UDP-N-acetylglucosamine acyltransferase
MATEIHPKAEIAPGAELGVDVRIGPYTVVGPNVKVGDRTRIGAQVVIDGVTTLGEENVIVGQASIGAAPQDLSYEDEPTHCTLGDRNTVREFVTINRGTLKGGGLTSVGNDCLLMACCHVAHDCQIEDDVILANNVLMAGHVRVGRAAIVNGAAAAHQFVTIGAYSYVGGLTRVIQDVPPFMILEGHPARVRKVNVIGLERAGYPTESIGAVRAAYRRLYRSGETRSRVLEGLESENEDEMVKVLVAALRETEKGSKGRFRETLREEFGRMGHERVFSNTNR